MITNTILVIHVHYNSVKLNLCIPLHFSVRFAVTVSALCLRLRRGMQRYSMQNTTSGRHEHIQFYKFQMIRVLLL